MKSKSINKQIQIIGDSLRKITNAMGCISSMTSKWDDNDAEFMAELNKAYSFIMSQETPIRKAYDKWDPPDLFNKDRWSLHKSNWAFSRNKRRTKGNKGGTDLC